MSDSPTLVRSARRLARTEGMNATPIGFLQVLRASRPSKLRHGVFEPSICVVLQGHKRLQVGRDAYSYGAGSYAMSALEFPTSGHVTAATPAEPYLAIRVVFTAAEIAQVIVDAHLALAKPPAGAAPVFVGRSDARLDDCLLRLVQLVDSPADARFLAGDIKREIIYRLLVSEHGSLIARTASPAKLGVGRAIEWLRSHFDKPIDIAQLARTSRMSVSSLRHEFKVTTALAPLQFQKQLRLQEARRLLVAGEVDAGTAAFRVGYESPSQFSREYRRLFGAPPIADLRNLRTTKDLSP